MNKTRSKLFLVLVVTLCTIILSAQSTQLEEIYYTKALQEHSAGNLDQSIDFFYSSLRHRLCDSITLGDLASIKHKSVYLEEEVINRVAKTFRNIGVCYSDKMNYHKALRYFRLSRDIYQLTGHSNYKLKDFGSSQHNLARVLNKIGEYHLAIVAVEQALDLHSRREGKNTPIMMKIINLLAVLHRQNGGYEKGIAMCVKGDSLYHSLSESDLKKFKGNIARIYHTQGSIYDDQGAFELALSYYEKALKYDISEPEITQNNIAWSLILLNRLDKAEQFLKVSSEKRRKEQQLTHHFSYSAGFENFAELEIAKGNNAAALDYFQLALVNLTNDFRSTDITTQPTVAGNHYVYDKPDLLRILDLKAQTALREGKTDLAYQIYLELDQWINEFYKDLSTNASKLTWIDRAHSIYGNAIETALLKGNPETAFRFAEKAHAVLLWQRLSQQAALPFLSPEDKEQLDELNSKIQQADEQYSNEETSIENLRQLEQQRATLEKTFEQNYPEYTKKKYQAEATTVKDIQANIIDDRTAFIEYYQTDSVLYVFTITKEGLKVDKQLAVGLTKQISDFVNNINKEQTDQSQYHQLAFPLFQLLVPDLSTAINRLIIVPDRDIGTLPFAALATQQTTGKFNKKSPFLVKRFATNYLYSAGSYLQLQQKKADQPYCFAGIAPVSYQDTTWKALPYAEKELEGMESVHYFWNKEVLKNQAATKAAFLETMKAGYQTVLVSTHALFKERKGQIVFYDDILDQDEIDRMEVNTHRLILSACETGVGLQNRGEGILSLGWNFVYKGIPSITMTHWKVNEYSTQKIMVSYHQQLNDGLPADNALQVAMLDYLGDSDLPDARLYAPYYWAAAVHTGNVE